MGSISRMSAWAGVDLRSGFTCCIVGCTREVRHEHEMCGSCYNHKLSIIYHTIPGAKQWLEMWGHREKQWHRIAYGYKAITNLED